MDTRIVRNKARIGKPWLLVKGYYETSRLTGKVRWKTTFQVSEHNTKVEALQALAERSA